MWAGEWVREFAGWVGNKVEIDGVTQFGRAKILRKTFKSKCRCDVLRSKKVRARPGVWVMGFTQKGGNGRKWEERGGEDSIKVTCVFILTKSLTHKTPSYSI